MHQAPRSGDCQLMWPFRTVCQGPYVAEKAKFEIALNQAIRNTKGAHHNLNGEAPRRSYAKTLPGKSVS